MQNRQAGAQQFGQVAAAHGGARFGPAAAEPDLTKLRLLVEPVGCRQHQGVADNLLMQRIGFRRGGTPLRRIGRSFRRDQSSVSVAAVNHPGGPMFEPDRGGVGKCGDQRTGKRLDQRRDREASLIDFPGALELAGCICARHLTSEMCEGRMGRKAEYEAKKAAKLAKRASEPVAGPLAEATPCPMQDQTYRGLPVADVIAAGRVWRALKLGDAVGYAIENRRDGSRVTFPATGKMDYVFAGFLGLTDRDRVDDMAETVFADYDPAHRPGGFWLR
jgi:hypothetical protein